jgi:glutaredoxin-like protein NrdH
MTTVYVKPACVQCDMTKRMLDKLEIDYDTVDITQDDSALEMVMSMGFKSAPVVITDSDSWAGFQPDKINSLAA